MRARKTSIIIVTYNALDYVKKCLFSIQKHTTDEHEVLVVDNASSDELRGFLKDFSENERKLHLVFNQDNLLWSPGNNVGLRAAAADSEYLMLLNSDTEVLSDDWLEKLQEPFSRHETCGITGIQHNFSPCAPMYGAIDGCCFTVSRPVFERLGLLSEEFPWNGAGFEYSVRAWANGFRPYLVDAPVLVHYGKRSRLSNRVMLENQKIDLREVMRRYGLNPWFDPISLARFKLRRFSINDKLRIR